MLKAISIRCRTRGLSLLAATHLSRAGDYAAGPNHVLPTAGAARFRGGLSVHDFVKVITVQNFNRKGLERIPPSITTLAEAEGLSAHAQSVRLRCANA